MKKLRTVITNFSADFHPSCILLDFGCGDAPYRPLLAQRVARYLAADLPGTTGCDIEITPSGQIPLGDGMVDIVLSTQVLEHVPDPASYLIEARRVLKPDGVLLLSTHGVWAYHPHPLDLWRWTGPGLNALLSSAGFECIRSEGVLSQAAAGLQLFQDSLIWRFVPYDLQPLVTIPMQTAIRLVDLLGGSKARQSNGAILVFLAKRTEENMALHSIAGTECR